MGVSARPGLLSLENSIEKPQQEGGTPEYPSVGSAGHHLGLCKPCDFMYRGSCSNGFACKFCHLCPPEARQQRKKERRKLVRAMARSQQTQQGDTDALSGEICGACDSSVACADTCCAV